LFQISDISTYPWPNTDRIPSPTNDETSSNDPEQSKKRYLLEQLQHVEKELHDKAQQHLKLNQEYRQQVNEYITSNPATTIKKKRTTSSSSATSSSSSSSKPDDPTSSSILPIPSQTINFFSTSSIESTPSSSNQSSHHHHPKIKKTINRQLPKYDRRLEQHIHDNQTHLDEMNTHLKNLKLISSSSSTETTPTKIPMRINTDTQKGLEHLRQLASNPSALERIQTLANNPNLIKEIQKIANQKPFIEQLRTLQQTSVNSDSTSSQQCQNLTIETADLPSLTTRHSTCCAEHSSQLTNSSSTSLSNLRFQNRIDVDCETESNHDTALTLACAGGHEELVLLLLQRNANIEHRDKKGFTPLILAGKSFLFDYHLKCFGILLATAGHANIVSRLIEHGANIEAQSERTKDTALSLACSGGRQDVVEVLLKNGANREHRNVSDYTGMIKISSR
jgi:ankyrin repeat protein